MMILVVPGRLRSIPSRIFASVAVSTALVESSRISTLGFFSKALAIQSLCFCPPDTFYAALAQVGVIAVFQPFDKFIHAGGSACLFYLFLRGVLLPPPQVIPDGSGKKRVFLKHHGYGIPQMPQRIFLHRMPVDADLSLCHIIQTGNQLHQRGFGSAGSSDDADCLAGFI